VAALGIRHSTWHGGALQSLVDGGFSWPGARRGRVMQMVVPFPGAETSVILPPMLLRHKIMDDVQAESDTA